MKYGRRSRGYRRELKGMKECEEEKKKQARDKMEKKIKQLERRHGMIANERMNPKLVLT